MNNDPVRDGIVAAVGGTIIASVIIILLVAWFVHLGYLPSG